jgi:hypothetical protein
MNRMFVSAARRGDRTGVFAKLTGCPPVDTDTPRSERLTRLLDEREHAMQAGDADALAFTEHRIDRLFEESRGAGKAAEAEQAAEQPPPANFDGGVRQRRSFQPSFGSEPTSTQLLLQSIGAARAERAQRDADPGQTIIARNF